MYAVATASESLALEGQHCRVDVYVDGQVTIHSWNGLAKSGAMFSSSCWDLVQSEFGNVGFIIWILRN